MNAPIEEGALNLGALRPGTCLGRWRVVEQLGVGGQGAVYRVEDLERPGDFYALKLALHARHARTEREGELMLGRAVHPHVVRLHGCARWPHPREGCLGLLMDWVPGLALDAWTETPGTTFRQFLRVAARVARTLGELHARGVLHRDLKPEHIVVREADGEPVLLDFGAGWYEGAVPLTTGPLPPATRYLLSPEAVRFLWHGPRHPGAHYAFAPTDDLYALGVCLYRATTGHYPFFECLPWDMMQALIVHAHPPAPAAVNPRVPRALSDIIVRLLAKEPRERYPSGEALHAALVSAADEQPGWDAEVFEFEDVPPLREGEAVERELLRPPRPRPTSSASEPPKRETTRSPWARRLAFAAALLWALVPGTREVPLTWMTEEWATAARWGLTVTSDEQVPVPVRNQKQAPCTKELEVEVSGACWLSLVKKRPPNCPPQTLAHKGECLWPVPAPPIPTSVEE